VVLVHIVFAGIRFQELDRLADVPSALIVDRSCHVAPTRKRPDEKSHV